MLNAMILFRAVLTSPGDMAKPRRGEEFKQRRHRAGEYPAVTVRLRRVVPDQSRLRPRRWLVPVV